jgi:cytochrome P450
LPALDLPKRVVQETLRIYPPAYNFSRVAIEDDVLGGYRIPKGSMVIVAPWASHRMPSVWPNAEGFDPDRFLPERSADRSAFAFIPFGAGQRACIGSSLALVQATIITTRICQRYVLDLAPGHRVEHVPGSVMRPRYGMRMTVRALDAAGGR